jgi:hypothetical protein
LRFIKGSRRVRNRHDFIPPYKSHFRFFSALPVLDQESRERFQGANHAIDNSSGDCASAKNNGCRG